MRRIAAIVLPRLACELAWQKQPAKRGEARRVDDGGYAAKPPSAPRSASRPAPTGIILEAFHEGAPNASSSTGATLSNPRPSGEAILDVVDDEARRAGVRPGQRVTEASALVAHLAIHRVSHSEIDAALGRVAEVLLGFGPTVSIRLRAGSDEGVKRTPSGDAPFDTAWVDVTGAGHLFGGEEAMLDEIEERVASLGHAARLAIAAGPRLAQALARWSPALRGAPGSRRATGATPSNLRGSGRHPIVLPSESADALGSLPIQALPVDPDTVGWLVRLGLITVGDLARLPRSAAAARLGSRAAEILDLLAGRDDLPLVPYAPPRSIVEEASFEDGVESSEALLFVLRGMTARASERLRARGEACARIEVAMRLDRSIAALRLGNGAPPGSRGELPLPNPGVSVPEEIGFHVDFPAPLAEAVDLLRALRPQLERTDLVAPAVSLRLTIAEIVQARSVQLDLSRDKAADPDRLPALLAELSAELGPERIGTLAIIDGHRPEARSRLQPIAALEPSMGKAASRAGRAAQLSLPGTVDAPVRLESAMEPVRLLATPVPLGRLVPLAAPQEGGKGMIVAIDHELYAIEGLGFVMRLDKVEWWTGSPVSRDYARAWLTSSAAHPTRQRGAKLGGASGEALIYIDRRTRQAYLQGWCE